MEIAHATVPLYHDLSLPKASRVKVADGNAEYNAKATKNCEYRERIMIACRQGMGQSVKNIKAKGEGPEGATTLGTFPLSLRL